MFIVFESAYHAKDHSYAFIVYIIAAFLFVFFLDSLLQLLPKLLPCKSSMTSTESVMTN